MARRKPSRKPAPGASRVMPEWLPYAACAGLAFAVYANSLENGFITDDQFQILSNPVVTGARSLFSAFGTGVWTFLGYRGNYFRPLQMMVYGAVFRAFGPSPWVFHLLMVSLHAVNTALVYSLARRLFMGRPPATAWIAAALFAVHPIHTEAVNWIAALPDVLVTTIALAGLRAFVAQKGAPAAWQSATHAATYLAALLTKETGVMLLPMYAVYQWTVGVRRNSGMYAGMLAALAIYLAMRVHALGGLAPAQETFFHLPPSVFAASAVVLAARYFAALAWPVDLNFFHIFHPAGVISPAFAMAAAALGGPGWAAWHSRRREPLIALTLVWTFAAIAPALNIGGVGQNVFAERYLYLPSAGFVTLAALAWNWFAGVRRTWSWLLAGAVLVAFSAESVARNSDWKDDFTLAQVTLRKSPESGYLHNLMAGVWVQHDQFERALEEEKLAVRYEPRSAVFHKNLGNILLGTDLAGAVREFAAAVALQPDLAEGYFDLGIAYRQMGDASKSAEEFRRALAIDPGYRDAAAALASLSSQ